MRISLLVGLPGSGKSSLAKTLGADVVVDDPMDPREVLGLACAHLLIVDQSLCDPDSFEAATALLAAEYPNAKLSALFFANDPQQCLRNAARRPDKIVDGRISMLSAVYAPPHVDFAVWRPVEDQSAPAGKVVAGRNNPPCGSEIRRCALIGHGRMARSIAESKPWRTSSPQRRVSPQVPRGWTGCEKP
jgi:hypothetical protein